MRRGGSWCCVAVTLVCAWGACGADGNEIYAVGAVLKGTGGAGVATPKDATWALLNPAGLVDLERRFDFSLELLYNKVGAQPEGFPLAVNPWAGKLRATNLVPIPAAGVVWPLERGTLGFGIFGIQGNRVEFPRPRTTLSLLANADRRSQYEIAKIPLAYGRKFENGWALGGAVVGAFTRFRTDTISTSFLPTKGDNHWDVAFGVGISLGAYKRWERWSFGACYSSRTWIDDFDRYESDVVRWNFDLPQKFQVGVGYRPSARWEIALDYKWMDWSVVKLLSNGSTRGGLGWSDQHVFKAGATYVANDRWTLRGGVSYGEATVDSESAFANAITPALAELHLAAGCSYRMSERASIHASLTYVFPEERIDTGGGDVFSFLGRGTKIRYQENAFTVQYSLAF